MTAQTCITCGQPIPEKPAPMPEITCAYCGHWFQIKPANPNVFAFHFCDSMQAAGLVDAYPQLRESGVLCRCLRAGPHEVAGCEFLSDPALADRITSSVQAWDTTLDSVYAAAHPPLSSLTRAFARLKSLAKAKEANPS
jgi:DNA-directed RNA polymerase subunit RPC12/RpoP